MRKLQNTHVLLGAAIALALGLPAVSAHAAVSSIGINVGSDQTNGSMLATDTAGVVSEPNWNQAPAGNPSNTSNITGPTAGALVDNTGATVSGLTASWFGDKGNRTWNTNASFANTGDKEMMVGYLDTGYPSYDPGNEYVSVAGLPSSYTAGYDIYVYFTGASTIQLNATSATSTPEFFASAINNPSTYVLATSTSAGSPAAADYAEFTGQTASSFKVTDWVAGITGVEIVADSSPVPEPGSLTGVVVLITLLAGSSSFARRQRA